MRRHRKINLTEHIFFVAFATCLLLSVRVTHVSEDSLLPECLQGTLHRPIQRHQVLAATSLAQGDLRSCTFEVSAIFGTP